MSFPQASESSFQPVFSAESCWVRETCARRKAEMPRGVLVKNVLSPRSEGRSLAGGARICVFQEADLKDAFAGVHLPYQGKAK